MARVRKLVMVLLIIVLLLIALVFSLENNTPVAIDFLTYKTPELSLAVWLISALFIGALLGLVVGSLGSLRAGRGRKRLERKLDQSEKALLRQRSENAKGI